MNNKKTPHSLYLITFKDGTKFIGGNSFFETKWTDVPYKEIKRIFVRLPGGDHLTLSGYDKYFFMVEATKDWMRINVKNKTTQKINHNTPRLEYFYIMGKKKDLIVSYRISLKAVRQGDEYKLSKITKNVYATDALRIKKWGLNKNQWK